MNNTVVMGEHIGEGAAGLLCVTNSASCCRVNRMGEFYYPNGTVVPVLRSGYIFYRNRGIKIVRLNRRESFQFPVGKYRCVIPDANGANQNLYIDIGKMT